jgi:ABC-type sugar transport system permease subunit
MANQLTSPTPALPISASRKETKPPWKRGERLWGLIFVLPMVILVALFTIYPQYGSIEIALYNWDGIGSEPTQFVGLRHLQTVAQDPFFWNAFKNNLIYTAVLVPIQLTLALMLALVLNDQRMKFKLFYRTVYFLPIVTSVAVVAIVMRLMLGNFGYQISQFFGVRPPIDPISHPQWALASVVIFGIWHSFGYNLIFFLAALQTVPEELYDAAKVDGANGIQRLFYVTLPVIRPVLWVILFLAIFGSMSVFEQSFVLTRGGPYFASEVVSGYIYNYAFSAPGSLRQPNIGYASAAALFFSTLMIVGTIVQYFVLRNLNKGRENGNVS